MGRERTRLAEARQFVGDSQGVGNRIRDLQRQRVAGAQRFRNGRFVNATRGEVQRIPRREAVRRKRGGNYGKG